MANRVLIGKKIKEYFSEAGMSQQEVAKVLNVQQAAVSNQLNGRPFGKNSAAKWNKAFGFRINWLLTGEGAMFDDTECGRPDEVLPKDCHEAAPSEDIPVIPARLFRVPDLNIYEYVTTSPTVDRMPSVPHSRSTTCSRAARETPWRRASAEDTCWRFAGLPRIQQS